MKIEYDNEVSGNVLNRLDICINCLNEVNNIFDNLSCPYGFGNYNSLVTLKDVFDVRKSEISEYKSSISKSMNQINQNELKLISKINEVNDIDIKKFDFEVTWN